MARVPKVVLENSFWVPQVTSSALVAYEEFDYVGNFVAEEFVRIGSKWYSVGAWGIGEPNNLSELREMATFASDHAP
jgi:hypothetical protein